ncbi:hypothetical protein FEM48_Zijuj05G0191400 [Ziziphus jujuba var. spinosa]|uniref:DUF599 domain-containing protein n=1 Tax=Ziziphus jujuba var. spinosa TaxID=714518 RepID=A0A978VGM0_ZIZJJ|nr:uncharacterized protein LOC107419624 [Ziziphus jujuba var. spinosa]KAH7529509.1 hypothetical protein FEM48_Zijuj05G0191400 [Ziziphus jujuba var. spinosa]
MEWRKSYVDVILVPLGFLVFSGYHAWLWYKIRTQPLTTIIGLNASARRSWISTMLKDIDKRNILTVQALRNNIMGSTLMATTSILLSAGLAAVISSTDSVKKPLNDIVFGAHGEFMVALKYATLLTTFMLSFFCHTLSILFLNEVSILIGSSPPAAAMDELTWHDYLCNLLERGTVLNTVGKRVFYSALPLLYWILGPLLVFVSWLTMVPVLYSLDIVSSAPAQASHINPNKDQGFDAAVEFIYIYRYICMKL